MRAKLDKLITGREGTLIRQSIVASSVGIFEGQTISWSLGLQVGIWGLCHLLLVQYIDATPGTFLCT